MAKPLSLDKVVAELVKLDQSSLPNAKEIVGRATTMKADLKERLIGGEAFPENTKYFARLKEKKGRVSYKRVIEDFLKLNPDYRAELKSLAEEDKETHPTYKVEYGAKQLELFHEN